MLVHTINAEFWLTWPKDIRCSPSWNINVKTAFIMIAIYFAAVDILWVWVVDSPDSRVKVAVVKCIRCQGRRIQDLEISYSCAKGCCCWLEQCHDLCQQSRQSYRQLVQSWNLMGELQRACKCYHHT